MEQDAIKTSLNCLCRRWNDCDDLGKFLEIGQGSCVLNAQTSTRPRVKRIIQDSVKEEIGSEIESCEFLAQDVRAAITDGLDRPGISIRSGWGSNGATLYPESDPRSGQHSAVRATPRVSIHNANEQSSSRQTSSHFFKSQSQYWPKDSHISIRIS